MSKKEKKYSGVIIPMITPFTIDGRIDFTAVEKIIEKFIFNNVYPFIIGTTGESASISNHDKLLFVEFVTQKFANRTKIYAGISSNILESSVVKAKKYFDLGVDAVVTHVPTYYPLKPDHMLKYYEGLANSINGPLLIYNITATTHMSIPLDVVDQLSYHENIVGLKDSERDEERLDRSIEMWKDREDFSHLIGWAGKSLYGLSKGSDGIIPSTGNFSPGLYYQLYKAVLENDIEKAEKLQIQTDEISTIYQKDKILTEALPALKVMMNHIDLCEKNVLSPFIETSSEESAAIIKKTKEIIDRLNLS